MKHQTRLPKWLVMTLVVACSIVVPSGATGNTTTVSVETPPCSTTDVVVTHTDDSTALWYTIAQDLEADN
jgi:hypothetical protein